MELCALDLGAFLDSDACARLGEAAWQAESLRLAYEVADGMARRPSPLLPPPGAPPRTQLPSTCSSMPPKSAQGRSTRPGSFNDTVSLLCDTQRRCCLSRPAQAFLHSRRVLHRDLKPSNVLLQASLAYSI